MKLARPGAEVVLLFAAFFCLFPYIPSHETRELPFLPLGAVGVAAFIGSRALRWRRHWWIALPEGGAFAAFALVLHQAHELLLNS